MCTGYFTKMLRKVVLSAAMACAPLSGYCGDAVGYISQVYVGAANPNIAFITVIGTYNGIRPACSSAPANYAIDISTNAGRAAFSAALAAKLLNGTISVMGSGNCAVYGDRETVNFIFV